MGIPFFGRRGLLGMTSAIALAGVAAGPSAAQTVAGAGEKAGVAGAVRGGVQRIGFQTPTATVGRNVTSGDEIFLGDRIVTGPAGGLQIMLLDGTTFTVGPNASMLIDRFVYDPGTGGGRIGATIERGTVRVISGRASRQDAEAVSVRTPTATVGIRGSIVAFSVSAGQVCVALLGVGPQNQMDRPQSFMTVTLPNGQTTEIARTGWGCCMTTAAPVCNPGPLTPEQIGQMLGQIQGQVRDSILIVEGLTGQDLGNSLNNLLNGGNLPNQDDLINLFQNNNRPGPPTPPPPPPPPPFCYECIGD